MAPPASTCLWNDRTDTSEDTMSNAQPGRPPVVDHATWQAARDELLVREKAHTREGDAIAAARRRLPMVEFDPKVEVVGANGPVPFIDLFEDRDTRASARAAPTCPGTSRTPRTCTRAASRSRS
jgi:predicted dithiol-disulfide oxidoreductase (DUF899 family)